MDPISNFVIGLVIVLVVIVYKGATIVSQGFEFTVERLGKYTKTLTPGFHILIPFIDKIGAKVNMMERVLDVPITRSHHPR